MNIDFSAHPGFSAYVLLLMFSGIVMVVMASPAVRRSSVPMRILNTVLGLGFFGYGFYLTFIWGGGTYLIFFKAFLLPLVLVIRTIQGARARSRAAVPPPAGAPGQPAPYPAAGTTPYPAEGTAPGASPAPYPSATHPGDESGQRSASV